MKKRMQNKEANQRCILKDTDLFLFKKDTLQYCLIYSAPPRGGQREISAEPQSPRLMHIGPKISSVDFTLRLALAYT